MLFSRDAADQVRETLDRAGIAGRIAVIDNPRLARRLSGSGREVVSVEGALDQGDFSAVVAGGLLRAGDWQARIGAWCHALLPGGLVVVVDRGQATELSRRALCAGLSAVEQRAVGRMLVTSGRWHPLG